MTQTISAMFSGQPVAMSFDHAAPLLQMDLPPEARAEGAQAATMLERGERFAITRNVAVVPIRGLMTPNSYALERWLGWTTYHGLVATMSELAANEDVAAIVLLCDSPGGLVTGCAGAASAIAMAAALKPVHVLVHPLAASGAYWLASGATEIVITPGSFVGSIGVVAGAVQPVQPGMHGYQEFIFTSSHARAKRPDPTTEAGRAEFMRMLDAMEADFHGAVSSGRNIPLANLPERLSVTGDTADGGAVFWGQDAVSRGLADRIETEAAFWDRIGASYAPRPPRGSRRSGRAALAQAAVAQARAAL